jgi:3-methyladenine DNA glycosylase AlkD
MPAPTARSALTPFTTAFTRARNPTRAVQEKRYLKSELAFFGAGNPTVRLAVRAYLRDHRDLDHDALLAIAESLFASRWYEHRLAASLLLAARAAMLGTNDLRRIERMLRDARTWALVDVLAEHVVGSIAARDPRAVRTLRTWARDDDFWIRRSALLALLHTLRRGGGDFALFESLAAPMLGETEFFVRKAIGWILRETSKKQPALVRGFLGRHARACSGVTYREAVKYLPARDRVRFDAARAKDTRSATRS